MPIRAQKILRSRRFLKRLSTNDKDGKKIITNYFALNLENAKDKQ